MPRLPSCARLASYALLTLVWGPAVAASDDAVTPYRPSVSNPAQLPAAGQLELELGALHSRTDGSRRDSLPYLFKLGFDARWGVLVGGEALVVQRDDSGAPRVRGLGDTNLIAKRAFVIDDATAFGLEAGVKIPTARSAIGTAHADYVINTIASRDIGVAHLDANLNATRIGAPDPGTASVQTGLSASLSHPLTPQVALTGEVSGTRRHGSASTAQILVALSYSPSKQLTLDTGLIRGLNPASPQLALFAGVVLPIARLW